MNSLSDDKVVQGYSRKEEQKETTKKNHSTFSTPAHRELSEMFQLEKYTSRLQAVVHMQFFCAHMKHC